jgi:hypothetical protein
MSKWVVAFGLVVLTMGLYGLLVEIPRLWGIHQSTHWPVVQVHVVVSEVLHKSSRKSKWTEPHIRYERVVDGQLISSEAIWLSGVAGTNPLKQPGWWRSFRQVMWQRPLQTPSNPPAWCLSQVWRCPMWSQFAISLAAFLAGFAIVWDAWRGLRKRPQAQG